MQTILLVEDDAPVRKVIEQMLHSLGYQVFQAGSVAEGLKLAERHAEIDLLVTDVVLPRESSDSLVESRNRAGRDVKVLYISGYPREMLTQYGAVGAGSNFLQKPFTAGTLAEKVREVLGTADATGRARVTPVAASIVSLKSLEAASLAITAPVRAASALMPAQI
jgi:CheY-like chemotaxis protein